MIKAIFLVGYLSVTASLVGAAVIPIVHFDFLNTTSYTLEVHITGLPDEILVITPGSRKAFSARAQPFGPRKVGLIIRVVAISKENGYVGIRSLSNCWTLVSCERWNHECRVGSSDHSELVSVVFTPDQFVQKVTEEDQALSCP